jgi:NDMA-dependent alcohol dehydrogenase
MIGPGTVGFETGDKVVFSFLPICGRCRWCASGQQNLCDLGASIMAGARFNDPNSYRMRLPDGTPVGQMSGRSTFATHTTVGIESVVRIDEDLPLTSMCLLGCGVGTGWGSAVHSARVQPGDVVIVMGVGGIGINAVQGARHAGAGTVIAVDPVAFKRESALQVGATHAVPSIGEAIEIARARSNGLGADSAIVAIGFTTGDHVAKAFDAVRKGGTVVVTGVGQDTDIGIPVSMLELTLYEKRIQGTVFGSSSPTRDIPRQIQMYRDGILKLDELITNTYTLDDITQGYDDMHAGKNIRGVIVFD